MIGIRKGTKNDLPRLYELIMELAIYENGEDEVTNTVQRMEQDGFGENSIFEFIVAEEESEIIGASIYYYRYSTWKGRRMYLEDLIVTESKRGAGAGKLLFDETIKIGKENSCTGMMWQVLDWNEPAINFYKKNKAHLDGEWINCHLHF